VNEPTTQNPNRFLRVCCRNVRKTFTPSVLVINGCNVTTTGPSYIDVIGRVMADADRRPGSEPSVTKLYTSPPGMASTMSAYGREETFEETINGRQ